MNNNDFAGGVKSMARNCLSAVNLIDQGKWTLEDMELWLHAVISDDATFLGPVNEQILAKNEASLWRVIQQILAKNEA